MANNPYTARASKTGIREPALTSFMRISAAALLLTLSTLSGCGGGGGGGDTPAQQQALAVPVISVQPVATVAVAGEPVTFSVTPTGEALSLQWQRSTDGSIWTDVAGAHATSYSMANVQPADSGQQYRARVQNAAGVVTSSPVTLTVTPAPQAPLVTQQPQAVSVKASSTATFTVTALGNPNPALQWQRSTDGGLSYANLPGAVAESFTTGVTTLANTGQQFRVVVTNIHGTVTSQPVTLTVQSADVPPAITTQPSSSSVSLGASATFFVAASGTPTPSYQWHVSRDAGASYNPIVGATASTYTTPATGTSDEGSRYRVVATNSAGHTTTNAAVLTVSERAAPHKLAAGGSHTCAIDRAGAVLCWGSRSNGQLGDGGIGLLPRPTPGAVPGLTGAVAIVAGQSHTCVLKSDRTVACWGANAAGQLGDGSIVDRPVPTTVQGLTDAVAIHSGPTSDHTCAILAAGQVVCWGFNEWGQLGDGAEIDRATPVAAVVTGTVKEIATGYQHTCAVKTDGTVACWGSDFYGQLGSGAQPTAKNQTSNASGLSNVAQISAGRFGTCATLKDGAVTCWGSSPIGHIAESILVPSLIANVTQTVHISYGRFTVCSLRTDSALMCWGENHFGQAGVPNAIHSLGYPFPALIPGLTGVVALSSGSNHACAIKADGTALCWGANGAGQLGDGTYGTPDRFSPTLVIGGAQF
jgi:alpha-tubulin suppressor-like RCC1 family protein